MVQEGIFKHFDIINFEPVNFDFDYFLKATPKITTIRKDKTDRWQSGVMIDFFIHCRQKDMFRFAPKLPVVSVQTIKIKYTYSSVRKMPLVYVEINDLCFGTYNLETKKYYGDIEILAQNDGFDTVKDFFTYFDSDFEGKIIHWTDFKY